MNYSTEVKQTLTEKLLRPDGPGVPELSRETNIPRETLYSWRQKAKNGGMNSTKRNRQYSSREKLSLVLESRRQKNDELGIWLREKGLHESQLNAWEQEINSVLESNDGRGEREKELRGKIKLLERDLNRKDKALAEMSALLVLKKKLEAILDDEEQQT